MEVDLLLELKFIRFKLVDELCEVLALAARLTNFLSLLPLLGRFDDTATSIGRLCHLAALLLHLVYQTVTAVDARWLLLGLDPSNNVFI